MFDVTDEDLLGGLVVPGGVLGVIEGEQQIAEGTAQQTTGTTQIPAQAEEPAPAGIGWMVPALWILMLVGLWFLMMRPQKKRQQKLKEMQSAIKAGDNVVTNGGMFGKVADVGTDCFVVEMGISGRTVKVPILKSDVLGVREPVLTPPPKEEA